MKILYVITSTDVGGAEKFLTQLIKTTAKAHVVEVVCLNKRGALVQHMQENGARCVHCLDMALLYQKDILRRLADIIDRFQPDVVHAFLYRAMQFCRLISKGKKYKLICSPHFDMSKRNFLLRLIDRFLSQADTLCIAESETTERFLIEKQKYKKEKVFLIPNGVDKTRFSPSPALRNKMRQKYGFSEEEIVFVSVARLAAVKDPLTLLKGFYRAYQNNSFVRLVLVGEGPLRKEIEKFINKNWLEKAVLLTGEQEEVNSFLNMADAFVLSSEEESLPLALLEAVCVGLPCLVTDVGDMKKWVSAKENGFIFNKKDDKILSVLMETLASNKELRDKMKQNALIKSKKIMPSFEQYQKVYKQIENQKFSHENF